MARQIADIVGGVHENGMISSRRSDVAELTDTGCRADGGRPYCAVDEALVVPVTSSDGGGLSPLIVMPGVVVDAKLSLLIGFTCKAPPFLLAGR